MNTDVTGRAGNEQAAWGLWATAGFSLVIAMVFLMLQAAVAIGYAVVEYHNEPGIDLEVLIHRLKSNGLLLSLATCNPAPACLGLTVLFAKLRKGSTARQYLAFNRVGSATLLLWLLIIAVFVALSDGLTHLLGRPIVADYMVTAYETAHCTFLLWVAIVLVAPVTEEIFFRGFIFRGIQQSWLGNPGAVLITALVWSIIHIQYNTYQMATIFATGILLGIARTRAKSVYLPIILHSAQNLIAMIETAVYVGR